MPLAFATRKVYLRDVRQHPAQPSARRADPTCVWPMINELRRQTQCEAQVSYDKKLADLDEELKRSLPASSSQWSPTLSWSWRANAANRNLKGDGECGRPARGPPMSTERRKELQAEFEIQEKNKELWTLSYYMSECPPPADRENLSAMSLIELQKRFPGQITDHEVQGAADTAHHKKKKLIPTCPYLPPP